MAGFVQLIGVALALPRLRQGSWLSKVQLLLISMGVRVPVQQRWPVELPEAVKAGGDPDESEVRFLALNGCVVAVFRRADVAMYSERDLGNILPKPNEGTSGTA